MAKQYDVFISYSRKDYVDESQQVIPNNVVTKIKELLSKEGFSYWFDEEGLYSGQNFADKIVSNIAASKIFLFLSTVNSNNSKWTCKEIACADELGKHIIPVRIDKTPYNKNVLFRIADLSYIAYYANPEQGLKDIVNAIKAHFQQLEEFEKKRAEKKKQEEEEKRRQEQIKLLTEQVHEIEMEVEKYSSLLEDSRLKYNDLVSKLNALTGQNQPIMNSFSNKVEKPDTTPEVVEKISFFSAIKRGLVHYFDFKGKATRSEYWWWQLFRGVLYALVYIIYGIVDGDWMGYYLSLGEWFAFLCIVFLLVFSNLSIAIRRIHDVGESGWWILCPIYNIILLFQPSKKE